MKKIVAMAMAIVLSSLIAGCASTEKQIDSNQKDGYVSLDVVSDSFVFSEYQQGPVLDPEAKIGSRKNPVPIGKQIIVTSSRMGNPSSKLAVGIAYVVRGDAAYKYLKVQNKFNDPPLEGYEYVVPYVVVANIEDLSGNDEPYQVDQYMFEIADSGYSHTLKMNMVVINEPDVLDARLYEGSYTSGYVVHQMGIGEQCYLVLDNEYWFDLGTKSYSLPQV